MTFFVRNISLLVLLIALLAVGLASYLAGMIMYEVMWTRVIKEKAALVEIMGSLGSSTTEQNVSRLRDLFEDPYVIGNGVQSLRLVDLSNRRILISNDSGEVGRTAERALPNVKPGTVSFSEVAVADSQIVD